MVSILDSLRSCGETPGDPPMGGGNSPKDSLVGILFGIKCVLGEWVFPQNWGRMGAPESIELALPKIRHSLGELRDLEAEKWVVVFAALEKVTKEKYELQ